MNIELRVYVFDIEPEDVSDTADFIADALVLRGYGNGGDDEGMRSVMACREFTEANDCSDQEKVFSAMVTPGRDFMVCIPDNNAGGKVPE